MDTTFLKDTRISLFSDLLALKFKKLCADFMPQNGQIEVPNSQTPNLEIQNPWISRIPTQGSIDHKKEKSLEMILIQDSSSWMDSYIIKDYFIFHVDFKFFNPIMVFQLQGILASTKTMELILHDFWWP
jgi:hypothetical protein